MNRARNLCPVAQPKARSMPDWKIPLFKVHAPPWSELSEALKRVCYSGYWAEGEEVARFEAGLRAALGWPHLFATNSCTSALAVSLRLAGIGPCSTVFVSPMTCIATVAPVVERGANVLWIDVNAGTGLIDPEDARAAAFGCERPVFIAVDWGGDAAPVQRIRDRVPNAFIIEDAAQAAGLPWTGADCRCVSFQAIKHLVTADGGCCMTADAAMAERGKSLTWFGIDRKNFRLPNGEINWDLDVPEVGFKANMNNVTAAIGNVQLAHLPNVLDRHACNGALYAKLLSGIEGVSVPERPRGSAFWVFTITCDDRDALMAHLQSEGIQASKMHARLDGYSGIPVARQRPLPGVDRFASRHLCLPCGWWVSPADVCRVVETVKEFYARDGAR